MVASDHFQTAACAVTNGPEIPPSAASRVSEASADTRFRGLDSVNNFCVCDRHVTAEDLPPHGEIRLKTALPVFKKPLRHKGLLGSDLVGEEGLEPSKS